MNEHLEKLKQNNPSIGIVEETEHINITGMWDDNSFMCRLENKADFSLFTNAKFPKELSAIFHNNKSLEFIYCPLKKDNTIIKRNFTFYYKGKEFRASFKEPTKLFQIIANGFRRLTEPEAGYRNLDVFWDFYRMKKDNLPKQIQKYFENRTPINFFIDGDFSEFDNDFISFAKYLNFYMEYFDRRTPHIIIHEKEQISEYELPCNYAKSKEFPQTITFSNVNPVLIDLFYIANNTDNIRQKFIFYFQVLEYCAYYYLNDDLKKKLKNIIKTPDLLSDPNKYTSLLIEEFKDYFKLNDDSKKLEKLLKDFCSWDDIKNEIVCNKEYFSQELEFDGGFRIKALVSEKDTFDSVPKDIIQNIKENVEKIRNVLVHIRESRENKVILPTNKNNALLIPYLYLVQRLAENVAIRYE
jgi:hypothetical protein